MCLRGGAELKRLIPQQAEACTGLQNWVCLQAAQRHKGGRFKMVSILQVFVAMVWRYAVRRLTTNKNARNATPLQLLHDASRPILPEINMPVLKPPSLLPQSTSQRLPWAVHLCRDVPAPGVVCSSWHAVCR
jgi:hypothetical protein